MKLKTQSIILIMRSMHACHNPYYQGPWLSPDEFKKANYYLKLLLDGGFPEELFILEKALSQQC